MTLRFITFSFVERSVRRPRDRRKRALGSARAYPGRSRRPARSRRGRRSVPTRSQRVRPGERKMKAASSRHERASGRAGAVTGRAGGQIRALVRGAAAMWAVPHARRTDATFEARSDDAGHGSSRSRAGSASVRDGSGNERAGDGAARSVDLLSPGNGSRTRGSSRLRRLEADHRQRDSAAPAHRTLAARPDLSGALTDAGVCRERRARRRPPAPAPEAAAREDRWRSPGRSPRCPTPVAVPSPAEPVHGGRNRRVVQRPRRPARAGRAAHPRLRRQPRKRGSHRNRRSRRSGDVDRRRDACRRDSCQRPLQSRGDVAGGGRQRSRRALRQRPVVARAQYAHRDRVVAPRSRRRGQAVPPTLSRSSSPSSRPSRTRTQPA